MKLEENKSENKENDMTTDKGFSWQINTNIAEEITEEARKILKNKKEYESIVLDYRIG